MERIAKAFGSVEKMGIVAGSEVVGCFVWFCNVHDENA